MWSSVVLSWITHHQISLHPHLVWRFPCQRPSEQLTWCALSRYCTWLWMEKWTFIQLSTVLSHQFVIWPCILWRCVSILLSIPSFLVHIIYVILQFQRFCLKFWLHHSVGLPSLFGEPCQPAEFTPCLLYFLPVICFWIYPNKGQCSIYLRFLFLCNM